MTRATADSVTTKKSHVCKRWNGCNCYMLATEPNPTCPQHSGGGWPPQCERCGRFMKWDAGDSHESP